LAGQSAWGFPRNPAHDGIEVDAGKKACARDEAREETEMAIREAKGITHPSAKMLDTEDCLHEFGS